MPQEQAAAAAPAAPVDGMDKLIGELVELGTDVGMKIVGAILLLIVGRVLIGMIRKAFRVTMEKRNMDQTLVRYMDSFASISLNILLLIAILGVFGVETTTFAGVLAAAGVAIGMAWSGLLANFAAGIFMIVLKPFKVGDMIQAGGVVGVVEELGLFATVVNTPDNIRTIIGNNKIFSDNIQNFTANPFRRVDLQAQLAHGVDVDDAIARLQKRLATIPNAVSDPKPDVTLLTFTLAGPVLAVRPYCHNDHYWDVYFATNKAIQEEFSQAGYPAPNHHYLIHKPS